MKKIIFILWIVFAEISLFSGELENLTDGPYFFWEKDSVRAEYVLQGKVIIEKFPRKTGNFQISLTGFEQDFVLNAQSFSNAKWQFKNVKKFAAISDIHGQNDRFVEILQGNEIIDSEQNWNWGKGHLIILGDVFDRGDQVTEALWLIHKLSRQAKAAGGDLHFLLGNHELMVLQKDLRYVNEKYFSVADSLLQKNYIDLFSKNSELGRWLRSLNTIIQINDFLFVHAGIHSQIVKKNISFPEVNSIVRSNLDSKEKSETAKMLFGSKGPFWYRGYFQNSSKYQQIKQDSLLILLEKMAVSRIVVGHTTQDFINPFFRDKVIPIDTGIKYGDEGEALIWEDEIFYRAKIDGTREQVIFENE